MNRDRKQALDYLRAPVGGLWGWAEDGAVLVWRDGSTIAFREEIVQIIECLAPNGLPSFGAIVFLLAACRGKLPAVADIIQEHKVPLPAAMGKDAVILEASRKRLKQQLEATIGYLARVSQFPTELQSGIKAKCVLAEAVFEPAKAERHVEARSVLRGMREPMSQADLSDPERGGVHGSYIRQIHMVAEGLKPHTAESLALRLRTGLDALPKEPEATLPIAERARRLIEELSRDREFGSLGKAARELMAAVRLPRRLGEHDQLPIGGVADITNRGALDRLLLSELAHDDLTLSARVALNEALYLRREPPKREPPGTLALLLDSGVRLWGIPRILAAAVAVAMIARDKQHQEVRAWRAHGEQLEPVDLLSRGGLTQHLGALETNAHPGESMRAFAEAVCCDKQNQSVLITHRDALRDPEFRRALAENPAAPAFVATVDREGRFELHAMPLARRPPLCEADLNLASIFDREVGVPPVKSDVGQDLPSIFGVTPFPFLLPVAGRIDLWMKAHDGFVYAILDRRLVRYRDQRSGARVLARGLPGGKTIWMDCFDGTVHAVKAGSAQRPIRLLSLDLPDGPLRVTDLASGSALLAVHCYGDAILLIRREDVRAYALSDGHLLGQATNPYRWVNGRFFRGTSQFYFVVWDGTHIKFEPVTLPNSYTISVIAHIFDREGTDGPWLIHHGGFAVSSASGERLELPMPAGRKFGLGEVRVSRNGHLVYLPLSSQIKDLTTGGVTPVRSKLHPELETSPGMPFWNIYRVVDSIVRLRDGLAISGRKDRIRKLSLNGQHKLQISSEIPAHEKTELEAKVAFSGPPGRTHHGCFLQTIQYPNGSKLFLDSRGLLHLKGHDVNAPEISLVLSDGEVAGWTSDGYICGPSFFFDGQQTSEPERVFERIMQFFNSL